MYKKKTNLTQYAIVPLIFANVSRLLVVEKRDKPKSHTLMTHCELTSKLSDFLFAAVKEFQSEENK